MEYTDTPLGEHGIRCYNPPGQLQELSEALRLSQAVVIPANVATVVTSGQCGFRDDGSLEPDPRAQIFLAFKNAEKTLKAAGVTDGWKSVYHMTTYCPVVDDTFVESILAAKEKYLGTNRPAWTGVSVPRLYGGAVVEITLYAAINLKIA